MSDEKQYEPYMSDLDRRMLEIIDRDGTPWQAARKLAEVELAAEQDGELPDERSDTTPSESEVGVRTRELMDERSIEWNEAWSIAVVELGGIYPTRERLSVATTISTIVGGMLLVIVPSLAAQMLWPDWLTTNDIEASNTGFLGWCALASVSALIIAGAEAWFGWTNRLAVGIQILGRLSIGVVIGTWASVIVSAPYAYDGGFAAAMLSIVIMVPVSAFAAVGFGLGRLARRNRGR